MKGIIILGSSNSYGNTYEIVEHLNKSLQFKIVDLKTKNIGEFDYEFKNREDDFLPLMRDIVQNYDLILFATPVYWYSMSGIMKTFFDRISDCLKIEKETGRKLRGMKMAALSCGSDGHINEAYYMPFIESANYLGMHYSGHVHTWKNGDAISEEVKNRLDDFAKKLSL